MRNLTMITVIMGALFLWACNGDGGSNVDNNTPDEPKEDMSWMKMEAGGLVLTAMESPAFPDAKLSLQSIGGASEVIDTGVVPFSFAVDNYELGLQTPDAGKNGCANSAKGQHIHLILNNMPYSAHYTADFSRQLKAGHYEMLAFVSRSYHESIKTKEAYVLSHFDVGKEEHACGFDAAGAHLFYSRPKGTYLGVDAKKVMLDFYLVNCDLSKDGYKVRATVNGTEFMIWKWVPYVIEGAPMGQLNIRLELLDKDGQTVASPFNPVERVVILAEDEPIEGM